MASHTNRTHMSAAPSQKTPLYRVALMWGERERVFLTCEVHDAILGFCPSEVSRKKDQMMSKVQVASGTLLRRG